MAVYRGALTSKQQEATDALMRQAQKYHRKIEELKNTQREKPLMEYEENRRIHSSLRTFEAKYKDCTDEIDYILNIQEEYKDLLRKSKMLLDRAETLKDTWGLDPNKITM